MGKEFGRDQSERKREKGKLSIKGRWKSINRKSGNIRGEKKQNGKWKGY